jgi:hypothetical protein
VPETVLKAALLRRAIEDIKRVMALRNQKQALAMLLQRGSVGDDLWQRFQRAEKEMEDEVRDVVAEVCFSSCFIQSLHVWGGVLLIPVLSPGQRVRAELGPNDLSVRERDAQQCPVP